VKYLGGPVGLTSSVSGFPSTISSGGGSGVPVGGGSLGSTRLRELVGIRGGANSGRGVLGPGLGGLKILEGAGLLLLLELLNVTVEEEVDRHLPGGSTVDGATHAEHLAGKKPVHEADGKLGLVVARHSAVNVVQGRVGVAKADHRDASVGGLLDSLGVDARIGDHQEAGLLELLGLLVGKGAGGEASSNAL